MRKIDCCPHIWLIWNLLYFVLRAVIHLNVLYLLTYWWVWHQHLYFWHYLQGLSTTLGVSSTDDWPSTLGQSQSVMNIPRLSPKGETKKRRAPALPGAPTPTMGHTSFKGYQVRYDNLCWICVVQSDRLIADSATKHPVSIKSVILIGTSKIMSCSII